MTVHTGINKKKKKEKKKTPWTFCLAFPTLVGQRAVPFPNEDSFIYSCCLDDSRYVL